MFKKTDTIANVDPELWDAIVAENQRQEEHIELIASENYASAAVMQAQGTKLTNKYAEGYPHKRYYGGCEYVDVAEDLAISRLKELFGADYANVQPHSGSQANTAVFQAVLNPGDTVLGMSLDHGGHLTHGAKINFSGRLYNSVQYGLDEATGEIDYEQVEAMALEHKPKMIIAGFSAYSRVVDWQRFRDISDKVGAVMMCDIAHVAGLIAAGVYPSPVNIADVCTSTTHKTLRGPRGGIIMAKHNPELEKALSSRVFPGSQGGPLMHVIAAKAVAFKEALQPEFKIYQQHVVDNSRALAKGLKDRGYDAISGGTDNHLSLISLVKKGITGKAAEAALGAAYITVNKNSVPSDPQSPFVTSGIRIGTPAVTTRGFGVPEMAQLATWMADVMDSLADNGGKEANAEVVARVKSEVLELCGRHPVYDFSD